MQDDSGNYALMRVMVTDVSELKEMDVALRLSESPLHSIADVVLEEAVVLTSSEVDFIAFVGENETILQVQAWSREAMSQ